MITNPVSGQGGHWAQGLRIADDSSSRAGQTAQQSCFLVEMSDQEGFLLVMCIGPRQNLVTCLDAT